MSARAYILCTAPRSGSTMLCGMLAATGVAGAPQSFFHRPDPTSWARGLDLPEDATLDQILRAVRATATDGLTGIRLQQHSFAFLMNALAEYGASEPARIAAAFGPTRYVWLRRQDTLAQAISLLRAEQTGLWHRNADGSAREELDPTRDDGYDAQAITDQIAAFDAANRAWRDWFTAHRITPHTLTYEALVADPQTSLAGVLRHLGIAPERSEDIAQRTPVPTKKLADATSDTWSARYHADVLAKRSESP
ncbi:MAG: Stf0 family sulfotransferase [Pseudomonadota bacterium]